MFNTGILLTLASANFKGQFLEFTGLKAGRYSDFEPTWYYDVAPLIFQSYMFVVVWPIIDFLYLWAFLKFFSNADHATKCGCCGVNKNRSRKKSVQEYVNTHSGPDFDKHNKYAQLINLIYVAFMHGLGCPLLFPCAILGIIILYVVDRLKMAYFYR